MDKFTKVKNIGKGNMGACALARNNEDGRYYVIKQVDLAKLNKKERQQSLNEAKVLSSLRHANVINYVDSFLARKSDHLCIVMEYADGGDLSHKVKQSHGVNFPENQVLDWFIQCALALDYTQKKKILHRDVKTQNIFLTQEGVCKLGDFGIARTLASTYDQANTFVGTPYYLSPELILERPYDYASDVWALGVVLYEMMALKHPFNANDMKALMHRILKVQYDPPPHVYSNELRSIVGRILVKEPAQRLKLSELLDLPIVTKRIQAWLQGGIVPSRYVASLVRHKLLPPSVNVGNPHPQGGGSELPAVSPPPGHRSSTGGAGAGQTAAADQRIAQRMRDEQAQKQGRRDEIRDQFRDVKVAKKGPTPPPGYHHYAGEGGAAAGGGSAAPMPSRDPSLLRPDLNQNNPNNYRGGGHGQYGGGGGGGHGQQQRLPSLNPNGSPGKMGNYHRPNVEAPSPIDDPRRLGAPAQLPQVVRGSALPVANPGHGNGAMPSRMQPSVRGLHGAAPPPSGAYRAAGPAGGVGPNGVPASGGGNSNIQAMLEKAAQQRLARQPPPVPPRRY